jgi:hypothetical protein
MNYFSQVSDSSINGYEYVEVQSTNASNNEPATSSESAGVRVVSNLIIPLVLLSLFVWLFLLMKRQKNTVDRSFTLMNENTEVIKLNNELLSENIKLQREILEAMQKSAR